MQVEGLNSIALSTGEIYWPIVKSYSMQNDKSSLLKLYKRPMHLENNIQGQSKFD